MVKSNKTQHLVSNLDRTYYGARGTSTMIRFSRNLWIVFFRVVIRMPFQCQDVI